MLTYLWTLTNEINQRNFQTHTTFCPNSFIVTWLPYGTKWFNLFFLIVFKCLIRMYRRQMFKCFFWGLSPVLRLGLKLRDYWQIKCNNPHASTSLTQCDLQRCTGIDACVHSIIKLIKKCILLIVQGVI